MVFCNKLEALKLRDYSSHNPYFNRWFSAIKDVKICLLKLFVTILILIDGFLQYSQDVIDVIFEDSHNPYFNRWFSAIYIEVLL